MKNYTYTTLLIVCVLGYIASVSFVSATAQPSKIKTTYHITKNFDLVPDDKKGDTNVILITIDDGPSSYATDMLATLAKHNIKAIFFINGVHDKDYPGMIKKEFDAGHTIGNHTWDHPNLKKAKDSKILTEIDTNTKLIVKETGQQPRFFRPPYGAITTYTKDLIKKQGMLFMNWSGAAKDWEKNTKDKKVFEQNILSSLHKGEIILIHEHQWTRDFLDDVLTKIEAKGYHFVDPKDVTS